MRGERVHRGRGFTLVELIVAMTIMSVIAVVVMPVIVSSTDSYASARAARGTTERVVYAIERFGRLVREAPFDEDAGGLGVTSASVSSLIFDDGTGIRVSGSALEMLAPDGDWVTLCADVDRARLTYFDEGGEPMVFIAPGSIRRVGLSIESGGFTLSGYAFARTWIGR